MTTGIANEKMANRGKKTDQKTILRDNAMVIRFAKKQAIAFVHVSQFVELLPNRLFSPLSSAALLFDAENRSTPWWLYTIYRNEKARPQLHISR